MDLDVFLGVPESGALQAGLELKMPLVGWAWKGLLLVTSFGFGAARLCKANTAARRRRAAGGWQLVTRMYWVDEWMDGRFYYCHCPLSYVYTRVHSRLGTSVTGRMKLIAMQKLESFPCIHHPLILSLPFPLRIK